MYKLCLHKHACFFISTATSQNLSVSLEIFLSYQAVYQYLLDNLVSRPLFVPTVIAALHSSNTCIISCSVHLYEQLLQIFPSVVYYLGDIWGMLLYFLFEYQTLIYFV